MLEEWKLLRAGETFGMSRCGAPTFDGPSCQAQGHTGGPDGLEWRQGSWQDMVVVRSFGEILLEMEHEMEHGTDVLPELDA